MTCNCQNSSACNCAENSVLGVAGVRVGKLERSNPLPAGTYWIDVIDVPNQVAFAAWTLENTGKVKVIKTEHFPANDWPTCSNLDPTTGGCWPSRDWAKFEVLSPVPWNAVMLGFPNIITKNEHIESSADTASDPDFSDNCDVGCQAGKVAIAGGVILGGVALILVIKAMS